MSSKSEKTAYLKARSVAYQRKKGIVEKEAIWYTNIVIKRNDEKEEYIMDYVAERKRLVKAFTGYDGRLLWSSRVTRVKR